MLSPKLHKRQDYLPAHYQHSLKRKRNWIKVTHIHLHNITQTLTTRSKCILQLCYRCIIPTQTYIVIHRQLWLLWVKPLYITTGFNGRQGTNTREEWVKRNGRISDSTCIWCHWGNTPIMESVSIFLYNICSHTNHGMYNNHHIIVRNMSFM